MIKLAIIGTGGMANAHAQEFGNIAECKIVACSDIVPGRAKEFAEKYDIPAAYEDTAEMFCKEEIDAVSVVTPDMYHIQPVLQAIEYGKHVMCEKPLASSLQDADNMMQAAKKKGILTAVNFSYRNSPATQKAAELVANGTLGRIIHVEGSYLQDWLASKCWGDWRETPAMLWRLSTKHGSAGVLGDIGVHLYDLVSFVVGDIAKINCTLKTFDKGTPQIGEYILDANDSMVATVDFENGAIGTLHSSRWATGHGNTVALKVYGDKGALDLDLDRPEPDTLRVCTGENVARNAWEQMPCPPVPNMYQRFITSILEGKQGQTSFEGAAKVQAYLAASMESSEQTNCVIIR
ncbi:MAG: Gfo/Idh/MocA family protein [Armatimonadota bacterium]